MIIWYICIGVLLSICNALMIKRMNLKKYIYYIIGAIVLNVAYMITTICIAPITILSLFEFFSINMLMYLAICDMNEGEMYVVAFAIYAAVGAVASFFGSFISVILFSVVVFGILFLMQKKSKNGMGMGDVYAISCMSLFCNISEAKAPKKVQQPVQQPIQQQSVQPPVQQVPVTQQPTVNPVQPPVQQPMQPPVMQPIPQAKGKEKVVKEKKQQKEKQENNPKKNLFLVLQLVLLGVVVAVYMSGFLNNADGSLNLTYLLGIVLALGAADFVLYREMFKNNKSDDEVKKKDAKPAKNNEKKPAVSMPRKDIPARPAMPGKEMPKAQIKMPVNDIQQQPVQQETPVVEQPVQPQVQIPVAQSIPQPTYVAPAQTQQYDQMSDFESEDTVVLDDNNSDGAYLEYFENGLSTKIKLTKENFMIGKLRGQCDFVLSNNKISKMHAEFITRGTDYFVKDYNSTNGTYINGSNQRIASNAEYQIFNGDRVTLANVDMTFRC